MIILHYLEIALAFSVIAVMVLFNVSITLWFTVMYIWFACSLFWSLIGPSVKRLIAFVRR